MHTNQRARFVFASGRHEPQSRPSNGAELGFLSGDPDRLPSDPGFRRTSDRRLGRNVVTTSSRRGPVVQLCSFASGAIARHGRAFERQRADSNMAIS